jgi:hypothetical protein
MNALEQDPNALLQTTDAQEWAQGFMRLFGDRRDEIDEGLMIGWFANAIETGRGAREALAKLPRLKPSVQGVYEDPKGEYLKRDAVLACVDRLEVEGRAVERDDLLRAVEAHMAEMDARSLAPGRDRDDIDNDLYNVAARIRKEPTDA